MYNVAGLYTYFIWNMEDDITGSRKLPNRISRHWNETSQYNGETRYSTKIDLRQELLIGTFLRFFFLTKKNTSKTRIQIGEQKIQRLFIFFLIWNKSLRWTNVGSHRTYSVSGDSRVSLPTNYNPPWQILRFAIGKNEGKATFNYILSSHFSGKTDKRTRKWLCVLTNYLPDCYSARSCFSVKERLPI